MVVKPLRLRRARLAWAGAARGQVSRARVPAHHLWARLHRARQPGTPAQARPGAPSARWPLREFALGVESLGALRPRGEPLWRVHQAVFGVLALESEPVDPRL